MNKVASIKKKLDEKQEFVFFFLKYQKLGNVYDKTVLDLYDTKANISASRIMSDGSVRHMMLDGEKYISMASNAWEAGKEANDKSVFSGIKIVLSEGKARITAHRYSIFKCYNDESYYMVVKKNNNGELKIIEEHTSAPQVSQYQNQDNLIATITSYANSINESTPIKVDEDTSLINVISNNTILTYQYKLITCVKDELDVDKFEIEMRSLLIQEVSGQNLRSLVEQGAVIFFEYFDCESVEITTININIFTCKII